MLSGTNKAHLHIDIEMLQQSDLSRKFLSLLGNREQGTGKRGKRGEERMFTYRLLFTSQITLLYKYGNRISRLNRA